MERFIEGAVNIAVVVSIIGITASLGAATYFTVRDANRQSCGDMNNDGTLNLTDLSILAAQINEQ